MIDTVFILAMAIVVLLYMLLAVVLGVAAFMLEFFTLIGCFLFGLFWPVGVPLIGLMVLAAFIRKIFQR